MKSNIKILCLALGASLLTTSCAKFLEEEPKGLLTAGVSAKTQDDIDMSLTALYNKVNASQVHTNMQIVQWQGDDLTTHVASNKQAYREADRFATDGENKGIKDTWLKHFDIVKVANQILSSAPEATMTAEKRNIALGQARYWRAYAYFTLVRIYGDLPLITTIGEDDFTAPVVSVADVYKLIEEDLLEAIKILPEGYSVFPEAGEGVDFFVNKTGAQATLAAVYMNMAGFPLNRVEYYAKAAEQAKAVITSAKYKLDGEYNQVYSMGNNYNKETIVGINYKPVVGNWSQTSQLSACQVFQSIGWGGWGDAHAEIAFWKNFPEGKRKDATYAPKINVNTDKHKGLFDWYALEGGEKVIPEYQPMFTLFTVNDMNGADVNAPFDYTKPISARMTNGHRHRIIRYSEVLLWYAEAVGRSGQLTADALDALNQVRTRAGYTVAPAVPATAEQLAEAAYNEHGWEVAGYWPSLVTRRADQFRMNRLKDYFNARVANAEIEVAPGIKAKESIEMTVTTWNDDMMYFPYPGEDASKNKNLKRR